MKRHYTTDELREAIMRLTMCARQDCCICKYRKSPLHTCDNVITQRMNTLADFCLGDGVLVDASAEETEDGKDAL